MTHNLDFADILHTTHWRIVNLLASRANYVIVRNHNPYSDHFEDFNRKQYTIEIFSPMSLVFHEDSKYATLEIVR